MDKYIIGLFLLLGAIIVAAIFADVNNQRRAKVQAQVMDCKHIGVLHAMRNIGVFECGNTIILKRIKDNADI